VSDVVDGTIAAMERGTGTYNVGGALEASMNDAIALFEEIADRPLDLSRREAVPGDQRRTSADMTRIRAELGWQPQVSLREGLEAQWEWARDAALAGRVG
jgi:nucleoside-diphosphate-sugar epimerase